MTDSCVWRSDGFGDNRIPEVSVGMPVYNGERYLAEAVESILNQTFSDFELIISDNASTDGTAEICEELAARDPRIRYARQKVNIGLWANWDFVACAARGTFFKWTSANDRCDRTMLEKCINVLRRENDVVLCYGRTCLIDGQGNEIGLYPYDFSYQQAKPSERFITVRDRMNLNNAFQGLIRLQRLKQTRLNRRYPDSDLILFAELALYGAFQLLPEILLYRRMAEGAASCFLPEQEKKVFLDPRSAHKQFTRWHLYLDSFWSVLRAPIDRTEKFAALDYVARHVYWDRRALWYDLFKRLS